MSAMAQMEPGRALAGAKARIVHMKWHEAEGDLPPPVRGVSTGSPWTVAYCTDSVAWLSEVARRGCG